jgi:hypothetical protein
MPSGTRVFRRSSSSPASAGCCGDSTSTELPEAVSNLEQRFDYYDRRHLLKPGITGWATVCCGYSGTPLGEAWKLCHDLYYLKRRSVLFDLLILIETASSVVLPDPVIRPNERFIVGAEPVQDLTSIKLA